MVENGKSLLGIKRFMNRNDFLKHCGGICLGGVGVSFLLSSCSSIYYAKANTLGNIITIKKSEFIEVKKDKSTPRKYVMIKTDKMEFPIFLYQFSDTEFSALYTKCTHQGCELNPQGDFLQCPCHGSEFDNRGKVLNPPAEQNLESFKTTSDAENIFIHFN